jgi:hypothetical protein
MMTGCLLGIIVGTAPFPRRERRGLRLSLLTRECVCAAGVLVGEGRLPVRNFQLHSFSTLLADPRHNAANRNLAL